MPRRPDPTDPLHVALTDRYLRGLRAVPSARDVRDTVQRGLIARVLPSGIVHFSIRYRYHQTLRRLKLGEYPAVSLREARKRVRHARSELDAGRDPAEAQRAAKTARTDSVSALAEDYLDEHARPNKRSAAEDERILTVEILPNWGDRSARDITRADVKALLKRIVARGSPIMANRVLALTRKMLNYGVDEEWIDANPAARIKKPAPERSRDRVLTDDELRRIWRLLSHVPTTADKPAPGRKRNVGATDDPLCPLSVHLAAFLKVRLLTAQRGGEVARMRWSDLDLTDSGGWWTIPGRDTKNGEPHRVWLAKDAVDIIEELRPPLDEPREYVFALRGGSITHRAKKAPAEIARVLQIDFKGHDFRRTASTKMAEMGISREHIAFVLNHVQGGARATQVYDRYNRDREKHVALETWSRVLTAILQRDDTGKLLSFEKRARDARAAL